MILSIASRLLRLFYRVFIIIQEFGTNAAWGGGGGASISTSKTCGHLPKILERRRGREIRAARP